MTLEKCDRVERDRKKRGKLKRSISANSTGHPVRTHARDLADSLARGAAAAIRKISASRSAHETKRKPPPCSTYSHKRRYTAAYIASVEFVGASFTRESAECTAKTQTNAFYTLSVNASAGAVATCVPALVSGVIE